MVQDLERVASAHDRMTHVRVRCVQTYEHKQADNIQQRIEVSGTALNPQTRLRV